MTLYSLLEKTLTHAPLMLFRPFPETAVHIAVPTKNRTMSERTRTPAMRMSPMFDVGAAWFPEVTDFEFLDDDDRLEDAIASYGFGISLRLFGLNVNWDFSKRTDLKDTLSGSFETDFWIGTRF